MSEILKKRGKARFCGLPQLQNILFLMDLHPSIKLTQAIRKFSIIKHLKRQVLLTKLVGFMIKARSVIFSELADKIDRQGLSSFIERRTQDFFQKVDFDYEQLLVLLICFVPHDKVVPSSMRLNNREITL